MRKLAEEEEVAHIRQAVEREYVSRRVRGMFLSRVISMGIGATLRLTVSYLKYIFVDGTSIDIDADISFSTTIDNIFPVSRREASFPVASPMKKPASQSQPSLGLFRLTAYLRLASCFSTPG